MLFRKSFLLIYIFLLPVWVFASNSRFMLTEDYTTFTRHLSQIMSIGKYIETNSGKPIISRMSVQRQALLDDSLRLYQSFQLGSRATPTFDISSKFQFVIQKYKLSCEIAATQMTIKSLTNINISEDDIFRSLRVMPEPLSSEGIWWDPDVGFVGSITGSQYLKTGYGIYEKPIAKYLTSLGFVTETGNMMDGQNIIPRKRLIKLFDAIESDKRVILWWDWCTTSSSDDGIVKKVDTYIVNNLPISAINPCGRSHEDRILSWKTPSGKEIQWLSWEHAFLLLWYLGKKDSPTHVVVWDTYTGRHVYPYLEWMRKWWTMQYRSLIVAIE